MGRAPCCPRCGGRSVGWGWTTRRLCVPLPDGEQVEIVRLRIKRFRCRACLRTWRFLPPLLLCWKRYAAAIVQSCWESWAQGASYESTAVTWWLRSVRTVQRWLQPLASGVERLRGELRRLLIGEGSVDSGVAPARTRPAVSGLLDLTRTLMHQAPLGSQDRLRVPYHFVMLAIAKA